MPLLEDDAFVEADTPFRRWLETAAASPSARPGAMRKSDVTIQWLIAGFDRLPLSPLQKSELYESLRIPLRWHLGNSPLTRTRNWRKPRHIFYHRGPLITRSQVSLADELAKRPPKLMRLSREEGQRIADMIREVMLVRYRELYGTTLADPRSVVRVDLGDTANSRGLEIYLWHLPPNRRLPAPRLRRRLHPQKWSPHQLHRSHRPLRMDGGRLQHFLHLPRRRSRMDLRPGSARALRLHGYHRRLRLPLPARTRQRRSDRVRRFLVLPQARIPPRPRRPAKASRAGRKENRRLEWGGRPRPPIAVSNPGKNTEASGRQSRLLRIAGKRGGCVGYVLHPQHRPPRQRAHGPTLRRRRRPHARPRPPQTRTNLRCEN